MSKDKASAEVQKLFQAYDKANEVVANAKAAVEDAMAQRSNIVKQIVDKSGRKAFKRDNGSVLKLMVRGGKDKAGNPNGSPITYFFRGEGETDALSV